MIKLYSVKGNKTIWLSIVGIFMLLISGTYYYLFEVLYFKHRLPLSFFMEIFYDMFINVVIVLTHIISMVIAVKVAKSLERRVFLWGLFAFIAPPIALIILGLMDKKLDKALFSIYNVHRLNYNNQLSKLKIQLIRNELSKNLYKEEANKLKEVCDEKLNDEMLILKKKFEERKMERVFNEICPPTTFVEVKGVCPACGANIKEDADMCHECGISFK